VRLSLFSSSRPDGVTVVYLSLFDTFSLFSLGALYMFGYGFCFFCLAHFHTFHVMLSILRRLI